MLMKKIKRLLLGLQVMLALGLGLFIKVKVTLEQAMKAYKGSRCVIVVVIIVIIIIGLTALVGLWPS